MERLKLFTKKDLQHIKAFAYSDDEKIDFLSIAINIQFYSAKITDFITGDIEKKNITAGILTDYLDEGRYDEEKDADIFLYNHILGKKISDFKFLYPEIVKEHGEKEFYTYIEVSSTVDNIRKDFQNKKDKNLFTKLELEHVEFFRYEDDENVDFFLFEIAPALYKVKITEFPKRKIIEKEVDRDVLIDYLEEGDFDSYKEADKFFCGNVLDKKIIDIDYLYPVLVKEYGDKDYYTYEEIVNIKNNLKKRPEEITDKKEAVKVKVIRRKK